MLNLSQLKDETVTYIATMSDDLILLFKKHEEGERVYQNQPIILGVTFDSPCPTKFNRNIQNIQIQVSRYWILKRKKKKVHMQTNLPMSMTRELLDGSLGLPEIPDMYARFILCCNLHNRMFISSY